MRQIPDREMINKQWQQWKKCVKGKTRARAFSLNSTFKYGSNRESVAVRSPKEIKKELDRLEQLFEIERFCNGSLLYTAMHFSPNCDKKKRTKKNLKVIVNLLQSMANLRICNEYFDGKLLENVLRWQCGGELDDDSLITVDWDIPLCSKDGLLSFLGKKKCVKALLLWIDHGAQWDPFTHLVGLNTVIDKALIDSIYEKWTECSFKEVVNVDGNPWNLNPRVDCHQYYVCSYFGYTLDPRSSESNWYCFQEYLEKSEHSIKMFLLNMISGSQRFRNEVVHTLELGTVDRWKNHSALKVFVHHPKYDVHLMKYILELAGVIPPNIINFGLKRGNTWSTERTYSLGI